MGLSVVNQQVCLVAADIIHAREMLLEDPPRWPSAERVDAAGVQLVLSAGQSGLVVPFEVAEATAFIEARNRLAFELALGSESKETTG